MERLEDESQPLVAELGQLLVLQCHGLGATQFDGAACSFVQQADDVEQRGFATSRRPHDAEEFAFLYFQVYVFQCLGFYLVGAVYLVDTGKFDYWHIILGFENYYLVVIGV